MATELMRRNKHIANMKNVQRMHGRTLTTTVSSNILQKSDRPKVNYFGRPRLDLRCRPFVHSVAAESVAPPSVCEFWVVTTGTGVPHSQWCKMDQRRAATRQRCYRSMSRSLDVVFRNECDEAGELCFPDVRTRWFPHRTVACREHWVGNGGLFPTQKQGRRTFLCLVSLTLARRRHVRM